MNSFLLSSFSLMALIIMMTAALFAYSLLFQSKSANYKKWLIIYFISLFAWHGLGFISGGLHSEWRELTFRYTNTLFNLGYCLAAIALVQIAYLFPRVLFEKERKILLGITGGMGVIYLSLIIWYHFIKNQNGHTSFTYGSFVNPLAGAFGTLVTLWVLIVFIRKSIFWMRRKSKEALPVQLLAITTGLTIFISSLFIYPGVENPLVIIIYIYGVWIIVQAKVLIFIIYSTFPIQFQSKLVGFMFASVMVILSVATMILVPFTDNSNDPANLAQRLADQEILFRLMYIILGSTAFILTLFPIILKVSLAKPLQRLLLGIQKADQGDLSVEVPFGTLDEIGLVTRNFNRMAKSLKQSKDDLTQYANTLEQKVSERTSQLKQSLDDLKRSQKQLIQQEKMASLGELTAGIAHEMQNPLNFVNNFSDVSKELVDEMHEELSTGNLEEVKEIAQDLLNNLERINHHGQRASGIVKGMLEHSKRGSREREEVDINNLAEEYLRLSHHGYLGKDESFKAELVTQFEENIPKIEVIPHDIGRVLLNIFNNAYYAVSSKARKSTSKNYEPRITLSTKVDGKMIQIVIADNGVGITEDEVEKIFQPFFTTKPTGEGTGLGLSLSYDIITQGHGGTLTVESEKGVGSRFVIGLPI